MTAEPLTHTTYVDPATGLPRGGSTARSESRVDAERHDRPLERLHTAHAHGWGIADGLAVTTTIGGSDVRIAPGVALDGSGRHISLAPDGLALTDAGDLVPVPADGLVLPTAGESGERCLTIAFAETFDTRTFNESGFTVFQFDHTPRLALPALEDLVDDGATLVLATLTLDADGAITGMDHRHRRALTAPAERISLNRPVAVSDATDVTVEHRPAAELCARPDGGVQLRVASATDRVEIDRDGGSFAELSITADAITARRADEAIALVFDASAGKLGIGTVDPLAAVHARAAGGFRAEDADGVLTASDVPLLAQSDSTAIGVLNADGRPAFAVNIEGNGGTATSRGIPTFFDRFDGAWRASIRLRRGRVGVGTSDPQAALHIAGGGLASSASAAAALRGENTGSGPAITASATTGSGVSARSDSGDAVCGISQTRNGVTGVANSEDGVGVSGIGATAGSFLGNVHISGTLFKSRGQFRIDHPLDPANRYLCHSFVESDEMKNVYDGVAELDAEGRAEITLPEWCEALNERFRYQLTPIGGAASDLHIAREVADNRFAIAGGRPGMRVSWQLTGVRHDPDARAHPMEVEAEKPEKERGYFLSPELYDQPAERGYAWAHQPKAMRLLGVQQERLRRDAAARSAPAD